MGLVTFKSNKTGELVQAEFPLHPLLIDLVHEDGSTTQAFRDAFVGEWVQQLPDLPAVKPSSVETQPVIRTPGTPLAQLAPGASSAPTEPKLDLGGFLEAIGSRLEDLEHSIAGQLDRLHDRVQKLEDAHPHLQRVVEGIASGMGELHKIGELVGAIHGATVKPPQG